MILPREEQETNYSQSAAERIANVVSVYSDDPTVIARMEKEGFEGDLINNRGGMQYLCENCTVSVRRKRTRSMTDEQRQELVERFKSAREKKVQGESGTVLGLSESDAGRAES